MLPSEQISAGPGGVGEGDAAVASIHTDMSNEKRWCLENDIFRKRKDCFEERY